MLPKPRLLQCLQKHEIDIHADEYDPNDLGVLFLLIYSSPELKKIAVHCTGVVESKRRHAQQLNRLGLKQPPLQIPEFSSKFCKSLSLCLSRSDTLQVVELHGIHFDTKAMRYLARGIGQSTVLKHLDLKGCRIGDKGLYALAGFADAAKGAAQKKEAAAVPTFAPGPGIATSESLQILALSACNLTDVGIRYICTIIKTHGARRENALWTHSLRSQSKARAQIQMSGLLLIDLQGNKFTSTGCKSMSHVLANDDWLLGVNIAKNKNVSSKTVKEWQDWMKEKMAAFSTLRATDGAVPGGDKADLQCTLRKWESVSPDVSRCSPDVSRCSTVGAKNTTAETSKGVLNLDDPIFEVAAEEVHTKCLQEQSRQVKCNGSGGNGTIRRVKRGRGVHCIKASPQKQKSCSQSTRKSPGAGKRAGSSNGRKSQAHMDKKKKASKPRPKTSLDLYESGGGGASANDNDTSFLGESTTPTGSALTSFDISTVAADSTAPFSANAAELARLQLQNKTLMQKLNASNLEVQQLRRVEVRQTANVAGSGEEATVVAPQLNANRADEALTFFEKELDLLVSKVSIFETAMGGKQKKSTPLVDRDASGNKGLTNEIGEALAVRMRELWLSEGKDDGTLSNEIGKTLAVRMHEMWNDD
jgi:hypothetical protein